METPIQFDRWTDIDEDLLREITQHIDSYGDYIRFRSTCKIWYLRLPKFFKHIKLPSPLLLLPFDDEHDNLRSLYHPEEKKIICRLSLLETKDTIIYGSCYGWLFLIGLDDTIQMMNSITREKIQLPPISSLPGIIDYQPDKHDKEYRTIYHHVPMDKLYMQRRYVNKVILSSPPSDDNQDSIIVLFYGFRHNLCFCRPGDKVWTKIIENLDFERSFLYDVIFHKGKIVAVDDNGYIFEYEIKASGGELISSRKPSCDDDILDYKYLVTSNDGGLLLVTRELDCSDKSKEGHLQYHTIGFCIYKLDESQLKWLEVKSLDDYVLVIGFNASLCVLPHTISQDKGNRIYYSDDQIDYHGTTNTWGGYDNGVFHLEDETIHHLGPEYSPIRPNPIWLYYF